MYRAIEADCKFVDVEAWRCRALETRRRRSNVEACGSRGLKAS